MKKMIYERPDMEVILFESEDVITSSDEGPIVTPPVSGENDYIDYNLFNNND